MQGLSKFLFAAFALVGSHIVAAKPSAGCGKAPLLAAGNHSVTVNGTNRWYIVRCVSMTLRDVPAGTAA